MANPTITTAQVFVIDNAPSNLVLVLSILRRAGFTNALPSRTHGPRSRRSPTSHPTSCSSISTCRDRHRRVHPGAPRARPPDPGAGAEQRRRRRLPDRHVARRGDRLRTEAGERVGDPAARAQPPSHRERRRRASRELPAGEPEPELPPEPEPDHGDEAHAVRAIIEQGGPDIVFQPIVELASGNTVGVEALARFGTDTHPPEHWFAYAATLGLGTDLEVAAISGRAAAARPPRPDVPPRAESLAGDAGRGPPARPARRHRPAPARVRAARAGHGRRLRRAARDHGAVARRRRAHLRRRRPRRRRQPAPHRRPRSRRREARRCADAGDRHRPGEAHARRVAQAPGRRARRDDHGRGNRDPGRAGGAPRPRHRQRAGLPPGAPGGVAAGGRSPCERTVRARTTRSRC